MKKIEAIIRQNKLEDVEDALEEIAISGITIYQVMGCGKQKGYKEELSDPGLKINLLPKVKMELIVEDNKSQQVVAVITNAAFTGEAGDGKIFISDLSDAVRIRTGEIGSRAI